jgi:hypothetical protein
MSQILQPYNKVASSCVLMRLYACNDVQKYF